MPTVSVKKLNDNEDLDDNPGQIFEVQKDQILYDELERQELKLPHGCLAGSCGSCRVWVIEGADQLNQPSAVEQDTLESIRLTYAQTRGEAFLQGRKIRLSCRARIKGDGEIIIAPLLKK
jgi:ferredoxin